MQEIRASISQDRISKSYLINLPKKVLLLNIIIREMQIKIKEKPPFTHQIVGESWKKLNSKTLLMGV